MSDKSRSSYVALIFGGILSIAVGVASGYVVNWLNEKNAELTYDITAVQAFPGQEKIGIVSVKVNNSGKKELENIDARIIFDDAELKEVIFQGLTPQASKKEANGIRFQMPFINPGETFSVQLLVSPVGGTLSKPIVDVRGKGAVATLLDTKIQRSSLSEFTTLAVAALGTLGAGILGFAFSQRSGRLVLSSLYNEESSKHRGDQRDIFAFVLGVNGFQDIASELRSTNREMSYWSISDELTERWLINGDEDTIKRACTVLENIFDYAKIQEMSQGVLLINAARLCLKFNDKETAKKYILRANVEKDSVAKTRVELIGELSSVIKND